MDLHRDCWECQHRPSTNAGRNWSGLVSNTACDGTENVTVPSNASTTCLLRVQATGGTPTDSSNANFTIQTSPPSVITVTSPNGGESWTAATSQAVTWTSSNYSGNVNIDLSTNNGTSWSSQVSNTANDGTQSITLPSSPSTMCLARVQGTSGTPTDNSMRFSL